ncbi:aminoglycoside phosphotransferase family enzyme/predicted kinase [Actinoplanes octamycinicus]|uniref:Aminoglycoside phosphotransferase family enzyme/predicted kinase n=1 Tax=Actinoplanes octamycinicus TaxID=135948 RepID=A0A7W7H2Y5_9ACTN|nr:AAA family ATPase [Actinoplanes octamycinicus]MBB4742932.1 aminoglycoside phosphotransferase family enzyme/predicted kinase [Actinoplanes octamycinicus]GIE58216.1 hypothetical protein Aoc01nite_36180 [Actinoplanes octamycinicus]
MVITSFGHPELVETHAAMLFLLGDRAYKLRKPVQLGFHDFRRRADRFRVCHREVQLNKRLAPDVYLGVTDVLGPDGEPCDHLVVMRRMPAARRLSTLVRQGAPIGGELHRLARMLAVFHTHAQRGPAIDVEGARAALQDRWDAALDQLRRSHGDVSSSAEVAEVENRAHEFLAGREALFLDRIAGGRIVDGHGDLSADDIFLLDDGPRVLDCLEYDDRLRYLDVLDDVACLAVDLEHLGAPTLAEGFVAGYRAFSGDTAPPALLHHYAAYRAVLRAAAGCPRPRRDSPPHNGHLGDALRHLRAGTVRLVLLGGSPATGRSTLAGQLGGTVLSADRIWAELAGNAAAEPGDRIHAEMIWQARRLLEHGATVILDAAWTHEEHRRAARDLAHCTHSELVELRTAAAGRDTDDWPQARTVDSAAQALAELGGPFGPAETGRPARVTMRPAANSRS